MVEELLLLISGGAESQSGFLINLTFCIAIFDIGWKYLYFGREKQSGRALNLYYDSKVI